MNTDVRPASDPEAALAAAKAALRAELRARRRALDPAWVAAESARVLAALADLPEFRAARRVAAYLGVGGEVRTDAILSACHVRGAAVFVPAFDAGARVYRLVPWTPEAALARGPLGIPQPAGAAEGASTAAGMDVVLVPGLGFDRYGGRLGQGGGHYDRFLADAGRACRIGLAFDFQIVPRVPVGRRDAGLDIVVTNTHVMRVDPADRALKGEA